MRRTAVAILTVCILGPSAVIFADTHYVSKTGTRTYPYDSWVTAADTVARAVEAASEWDTIMIGPGHFVTDTVRLKKGQVLRGLGEDSTVLDTLPLNPERSIVAADSCEISYLTIKGLNTLPLAVSHGREQASLPAVSNSGIKLGEDQGMVIKRVRFESLWIAVGASFSNLSNTDRLCRIDSCEFFEFVQAVYGFVSRLQISNSTFHWDQSVNVGIIMADFSELAVDNCTFFGYEPTTAEAGAAAISTYRSEPIIVRNCLFYSTVWLVSALDLNYQDGSTDSLEVGIIENNTFVRCFQHLRVDRPGFVFRNNILMWDQSGSTTPAFYNGFAVAEYNITWDNSPWDSGVVRVYDTIPNDVGGNHDNREIYPMFVDTIDFLLQAFSPAIDAGDPSILDADGSRSDIGYTGGPFGETYAYLDLPPAVPKGFADGGFYDAKQTLTWRRNMEADFDRYELFRDMIPIESADSTLLRAVLTAETTYADTLEMPLFDYYFRLRAVDAQGNASELSNQVWHVHGAVDDGKPVAPRDFVLHPNYPNPFNASTRVTIDVPTAGRLDVALYDVLGRRVVIIHGGTASTGRYNFDWDAGDASSGVYFIVARFGGTTRLGKMLLLK